MFFFFRQKTAYDMRISDWSSDVVLFRSTINRRLRAKCRRSGIHRVKMSDLGIYCNSFATASSSHENDTGPFAAGPFAWALPDVGKREIGRESCRERVCQSV